MKTLTFFTGMLLVIAGCSTEHLPLMIGLSLAGLVLMFLVMPERGE